MLLSSERTIYETNPKRRTIRARQPIPESQRHRDEGRQLPEGNSKGLLRPGRRHQPQPKGPLAGQRADRQEPRPDAAGDPREDRAKDGTETGRKPEVQEPE